MSRGPDEWGTSPLTSRQRRISTIVSLALAVVVMALTQNLLWGFVTFLVLGVLVNAVMYIRRPRR
ncbi:MAG: hypothetical protein IIC82_01585 [Chloroflexi bacterium]|nr:hypothetical protein [Chloroflexota bacterium]